MMKGKKVIMFCNQFDSCRVIFAGLAVRAFLAAAAVLMKRSASSSECTKVASFRAI